MLVDNTFYNTEIRINSSLRLQRLIARDDRQKMIIVPGKYGKQILITKHGTYPNIET